MIRTRAGRLVAAVLVSLCCLIAGALGVPAAPTHAAAATVRTPAGEPPSSGAPTPSAGRCAAGMIPRLITTTTGALSFCPSNPAPSGNPGGTPSPDCSAPGVNDWCPAWQSADYSAPAGRNNPGYNLSDRITETSPDGREVFVTGTSAQNSPDTDNQVVTIAYDTATGNTIWVAAFQAPSGTQSFPQAIAVGGSRVFVTVTEESNVVTGATVAYDATGGAVLWTTSMPFSEGNAVSADGSRVYLIEREAIAAYDGATGDFLWQTPDVTCATGQVCGGFSIALAAGRVYLAGVHENTHNFHVDSFDLLIADAITGATLATSSLTTGDNADDQAGVVVSPDGSRAFIAFQALPVDSAGTRHDVLGVAGFDGRTGALAWQADYFGPAASVPSESLSNSAPFCWGPMGISPDGSRLYVTTDSTDAIGPGFGGAGFTTLAYDAASGTQLWASEYNTTTPFYAISVAFPVISVDPAGRAVYVTGPATPDALSFATVAYDASTGAALGHAVFAGDAFARGQALSPDGSQLFVAAARTSGVNGTSGSTTAGIVMLAYATPTGPAANVPEAPWAPALVLLAAAGAAVGRRRSTSRRSRTRQAGGTLV